ncbi:MAG: HNH endonuclease [Chloroflexi bacterium]|nr:HNH endonuclease [Chloroflexota bacterium]
MGCGKSLLLVVLIGPGWLLRFWLALAVLSSIIGGSEFAAIGAVVFAFAVVIKGGNILMGEEKKEPDHQRYSGTYAFRTGSEYPYDWDRIRQQALTRDGHRCGNCGSNTKLQVHHIVPLSKVGTNQLSNLRTLCLDCHKRVHPYMD